MTKRELFLAEKLRKILAVRHCICCLAAVGFQNSITKCLAINNQYFCLDCCVKDVLSNGRYSGNVHTEYRKRRNCSICQKNNGRKESTAKGRFIASPLNYIYYRYSRLVKRPRVHIKCLKALLSNKEVRAHIELFT